MLQPVSGRKNRMATKLTGNVKLMVILFPVNGCPFSYHGLCQIGEAGNEILDYPGRLIIDGNELYQAFVAHQLKNDETVLREPPAVLDIFFPSMNNARLYSVARPMMTGIECEHT